MSVTLLSSPLQGFTDFRFRNAFHKHFGGIDTFYSPYIRLNGKLEIKASYERDILPENNTTLEVIPQIITNDADEFLFVAKYVQSLGYKELNWNLGCPYPMVAKCGMGSGLISNTERIHSILDKVHSETNIVVSMKMRMGYENAAEILEVFPILEKYPIKSIAIHARIGKQVYKGDVDLDSFQRCLDVSKHKLYYNGDITSVEKFRDMQARFPSIDHLRSPRNLDPSGVRIFELQFGLCSGGQSMKKSRFTEEQIAFALRQSEAGTPIVEVCRKMGVSEQTFYRWKKLYAGMGVAELRRLKQLEDENRKLKTLVADLSLDKQILQDALKGKL